MYYYNQQSPFFSFSEKELYHNGIRYDATHFIEKSEVAKEIFQKTNTYSVDDRITEQVFEAFFYLAIGQVRQCPPDFIPNILDLARQWKCNNVEPEIERQILEYPNPNLILRVLLDSPHNSFPRIYEFIYNNLDNFISNPNLYELPVASLGKIFYSNYVPISHENNFSLFEIPENPSNSQTDNSDIFSVNGIVMQGPSYKESALQLIRKKREEDKRHNEMKKIEAIKNDKIQNLKIKNDKLLAEKNNLLSQRNKMESQNNLLLHQIDTKKEEIKTIELQTQHDIKYADDIRNKIQKLKKEINRKEQIQKEILEFKKRNRQWRKQ